MARRCKELLRCISRSAAARPSLAWQAAHESLLSPLPSSLEGAFKPPTKWWKELLHCNTPATHPTQPQPTPTLPHP